MHNFVFLQLMASGPTGLWTRHAPRLAEMVPKYGQGSATILPQSTEEKSAKATPLKKGDAFHDTVQASGTFV